MVTWRTDQIAYYPVPIPYLSRVTQLIEELDGMGSESDELQEQSPVVRSPETEWLVDDLNRLLPLIQHNRAAMAVLDMTAAEPDEMISFPDACASVGMNTSQGRSGMGALTKLMKRLGKKDWPITYHWGGGGKNVAYYRMSREMSARWREVKQKKGRTDG